jgi:hypothetical protein
MPITINLIDSTPICLNHVVNNATIDYEGMVDTAAENDVAISVISNDPTVTVGIVNPATQTFPLTSNALPSLDVQLNVNNPDDCKSQVTITITFKTAQGITAIMNVVFLY